MSLETKVAEAKFRLEGGGEGVCNCCGDLEQILWASPALPLLVKEVSRGYLGVKPRDKGLPQGLGCPLSRSPPAMVFSLLRQ